ncbi:uncharacterized protein LOC123301293 [Chrysoperla carnea]|uniref:uncharacterized protein LOC123301293 n=1 Tax=Chrysoperla carnea TaxID=189513 RepID=UPI001D086277|nr:uncharacterized protein LOC123301293 [Chrysoperla carnea]
MNSTEVNRSQVVEKTSSNDPKRRSRKSKKCKIKINSDKTKNDTFTSYLNNNTTRRKRRRMEIIKTEGITSNITNGIPDNKRLENKDNVETTPNTIENSQINDHKFEDIASNNTIKNVRKAEITSIIPMKHLKPEETTLYVFENTQIQQSLINLTGGILEKKSLKLTVTAKNRTENHIELVTKFTEAITVSTENYASTEITVNTTENPNEFIINEMDDNTNDEYRFFNESNKISSLGTAKIIRIVLKNRR